MKLKSGFRNFVVLLLSTSILTSIGGCSSSAEEKEVSSKSEIESTQAVTSNAASDEKIEISLMDFFVEGDGRYSLGQATIEKFEASHPNVTVVEEAIAHDLYVTKMQTLGVTEDLPDVFFMKGAWTDDFANAGSIEPWTEALNADPEWRDNFTTGALANHIYKDEIWSLPFTVDLNSLFYYNDKLFTENNIKVPTTWSEMLDMIDAFNKIGITPMALGNKDQWLIPTASLSCFTALYGGADYMQKLCFGDAKYTDGPYIKALDSLVQMVDLNAFNTDFNSIDNYQMYSLVGTGEAATFIAGSWAAQTYLDTANADIGATTKVTVLPTFEDGAGKYNTVAGGSGWGLQINPNLTGAKRDAAIALAKAFTDETFAKDEIELASIVPAVKNYTYDETKITPLFKNILEIAAVAELTPVFDQVLSTEIGDVMNKTAQNVMSHGMTSLEAATEAQAVKDRLTAK